MNDQLKYLSARAAAGKMSRREFMSRAAALGVSAAVANTFMASAAKAAGPDLTGADCYKALTQMKNYKRWDVGVPVTFGETRRIGCDMTHIYRLNNNRMNDLGYLIHPNLTKFKF